MQHLGNKAAVGPGGGGFTALGADGGLDVCSHVTAAVNSWQALKRTPAETIPEIAAALLARCSFHSFRRPPEGGLTRDASPPPHFQKLLDSSGVTILARTITLNLELKTPTQICFSRVMRLWRVGGGGPLLPATPGRRFWLCLCR